MRFTLKFEIISKPLTTREKQRKYEREYNRKRMQDPEFREKKNKRNLEAYHKRMQDPVKREKDRKRNRERYKKKQEE